VIKILISIYIWTIGLVSIGLMLIIGIVLSYFLSQKAVDRFIKFGCRLSLKLMLIRVETAGEEYIKPAQTYLFMANHVSLFDVPVLEGYIPQFFRAIEADRQFKWPIYGFAVRRLGNIPISRESIHASIRSMKKAVQWLKLGNSLMILPEGHRTLDGKLGPFKKLPFHVAKQADVEILPIGTSGLFHLKAKKTWIIRPTRVTVKIGPSIPLNSVRDLSETELRDHVREKIEQLIERP
jgi:1-acyl-sn-glycerol-3-phosphate acyltransferase